jgi:hypothetical protein
MEKTFAGSDLPGSGLRCPVRALPDPVGLFPNLCGHQLVKVPQPPQGNKQGFVLVQPAIDQTVHGIVEMAFQLIPVLLAQVAAFRQAGQPQLHFISGVHSLPSFGVSSGSRPSRISWT